MDTVEDDVVVMDKLLDSGGLVGFTKLVLSGR
jgi:hypothetical protein